MNACKCMHFQWKKWIHLPEIHSCICDSFVCFFVFLMSSCLLVLISLLACMGLQSSDCLFINFSFPSFLSFYIFLPSFPFCITFLCLPRSLALIRQYAELIWEDMWENRRRKQKCRNGMKMGKFYNKVTSLHIPKTVIKIRDSHIQKNYFAVTLLRAPLTSLFLRL